MYLYACLWVCGASPKKWTCARRTPQNNTHKHTQIHTNIPPICAVGVCV